ncbi:hypothetical protein ACX9R5_04155 [Rathayibacter sp. CAU 1779]
MTRKLDTEGESPTELRRRRVFRVRIWIGVGCYVLASLVLSLWGQGTSPWRVLWIVLPLIALAWMVFAIMLRMRQLDEYQLKLFFPGLAVGFTVSIVTALTLATLGSAGIAVPSGGWIVAILGVLSWELTNVVVGAPKA